MKRTIEDIKQIYKEYCNGISQKELDKKYKTDTHYFFKKFNLNCRKPEQSRLLNRKNKLLYNYTFEKISNSIEAYILGLWFADGWVGINQSGIRLKSNDLVILEKIRNYVCPDLTIKEKKGQSNLIFSNKILCNNLQNLGCLQAKTHKNYVLPNLKKELHKDFIRGFFDGDGTIFLTKGRLKANICGINLPFLKSLQSILLTEGIECTINTEIRENKTYKVVERYSNNCKNMHRLYIRKKEAIKKFYNYLYIDSSIYLERKKQVFDNYYSLYENR
jgi:hypothetical protein